MDDPKRTAITAKAVPLQGDDIDTDRIIPARYLKCLTFDGLAGCAFIDDRSQLRQTGELHPFDDPAFGEAQILLTGSNFGCGSSREHAPQALLRWNKGIRAVVGRSFAEIFFGNCLALGIPCATADGPGMEKLLRANRADPDLEFRLDLEEMKVCFGAEVVPIFLPEGPRRQLLDGKWDPTRELLEAVDQIARTAAALPYFGGWR